MIHKARQQAVELMQLARQDMAQRQYGPAAAKLSKLARDAASDPSLLTGEQSQWLKTTLWVLSPRWSEPVAHGMVSLRRCRPEDAEFFRASFQDQAFTHRFNRRRPWKGDLSRALLRFGQEPPVLLTLLQWVVCRHGQPIGLLSLSHIDPENGRPSSHGAGVGHKASLLALHFAFFVAGFQKLCAYVYEDNAAALKAALHLGFKQEGFLVDHFRLPPNGHVSVHALGLTRQQALETPALTKAVRRRIGQDWHQIR
jgi:RimJ/RimL family protein N-acetyltransferase